jgi:hypothetical protein
MLINFIKGGVNRFVDADNESLQTKYIRLGYTLEVDDEGGAVTYEESEVFNPKTKKANAVVAAALKKAKASKTK